MKNETVLVTGASGFIAMHCILQLLEQGYKVRGTLRALDREKQLRAAFEEHIQAHGQLEFVIADLLADRGWEEASQGCAYILHLASPFPNPEPKNENELIVPAKQGTLRVLDAAKATGVKRVVLTSSIAAITEGYGKSKTTFDENDWSNLGGKIGAYAKSKTLAEQAAWEYIENQSAHHPIELSVINPGFVLGPILSSHIQGTSASMVRKYLAGEYPGSSRTFFNIVDVRDVAAAHLSAMVNPNAAGKRFCCVSDGVWLQDLAKILKKHFGNRGYKVSTILFPDFMVRILALFDDTVKPIIDGLGTQHEISNAKIIEELNWEYRKAEEMIVDMGESLIKHGLV